MLSGGMEYFKATYQGNDFFTMQELTEEQEETIALKDNGEIDYAVIKARDRLDAEVKAFKIGIRRNKELGKPY